MAANRGLQPELMKESAPLALRITDFQIRSMLTAEQ